MLLRFVVAQLAAGQTQLDSTYTTLQLRQMIAAAAAANREPPPALHSYTSHIETEAALILRDTLGGERSAEIEQLAAHARWERGDRYALHVVGYRSQNLGVPYSLLSVVRSWTVPSLYGNRLSLAENSPAAAMALPSAPFIRSLTIAARFTASAEATPSPCCATVSGASPSHVFACARISARERGLLPSTARSISTLNAFRSFACAAVSCSLNNGAAHLSLRGSVTRPPLSSRASSS